MWKVIVIRNPFHPKPFPSINEKDIAFLMRPTKQKKKNAKKFAAMSKKSHNM